MRLLNLLQISSGGAGGSPPYLDALSLLFSSSVRATVPGSVKSDGSSPFSWAVWLKIPSSTGYRPILGHVDGGPAYQGMLLYSDNLKLSAYCDSATPGNSMQVITTSDCLVVDQWHLVVWTYGGYAASQQKIYVDGASVALTTISNTLSASISGPAQFYFGYEGGVPFTGNQDEITRWSAELSQAEVTALYSGGSPANPTDNPAAASLTNHWPVGDGDTFPTLTDAVGGANATVVNGSSANFVGDVPA